MGQNAVSSKTQETPAESSVDVIHEEQRLPQVIYTTTGPSDIGAHLSSLPRTDLTVIKPGKELQPVSRQYANAVAGDVIASDSSCSIGADDSLANSIGNSKKVGGLLGLHNAGRLPLSTTSHVQEKLKFPAEGQEIAQRTGDATWIRDTMHSSAALLNLVYPLGFAVLKPFLTMLQGPSDIGAHLSSLPRTDLTVIKPGKELQPVSRQYANAVAGDVIASDSSCSIGADDSLANSIGNSKKVGGLSGLHNAGRLPLSTTSHVQEKLKFPAEGQEIAQLTGDATWIRDTMQGRLNASTKENVKLKEDLKNLSQQWEDKIHEQKGLLFGKEKEVAILNKENQQFCERISELYSRAGQVFELRDTLSGKNTAIGQLRKIGKMFDELCCENRALHEGLLKSHTELESVKRTRASEAKLMEGNMLRLEEVNCKLEEKVAKIQQQLCKERAGQDGTYVDGQQTPSLWEATAKETFSSIATFSALLSKDAQTHHSIVQSDLWKKSRLSRERHWTYLLKNVICGYFFANFESERLVSRDSSVLFLDPAERVSNCFEYFKSCKNERALNRAFCHASNDKLDYLFFEYLAEVSLCLLPQMYPIISEIFTNHNEFTRVRFNDMLSSLPITDRNLFQSFVLAAEKVWQFHKLCLSFEPPATIFRVPTGETFNQHYMESTDALETDGGNSVPTVAFMVYPGLRLRKSIVKCEVYVTIET